jgi:hypothetical protein
MAEQKINWDALSTSDLEAIANNDWDSVSTPALKVISGEGFGTGETLGRSFERTATAALRGLSQMFGNDLDFYNNAFGYQTDLSKEQEYRAMMETNTGAAVVGSLAGAVADPTNFIPIFRAQNIKQFAAQGAVLGGGFGLIEPTYEEEFDDSRLKNTAIGTVFGTALGAGIGKLVSKAEASRIAAVEPSVTPSTKIDDVIQEPAIPANVAPEEFAQAMEIQRKIDAGEAVSSVELNFLDTFNAKLPPLTADATRAADIQLRMSRGELVTPEEEQFLQDFANKSVFDLSGRTSKFASKEEAANTPMNKAAVEGGSEVSVEKAMSEAENFAFKTGDYRDYLKNSAIRFANLTPTQFSRMIDPTNPYKDANVKVLISKSEEDQDLLKQVLGSIEGRVKYERQAGKTFAEIEADSLSNVPPSIAVEAVLNRKIQEILPPEVMASFYTELRNVFDDLNNARALARVARERGSEEGYAVLQSMMGKAAALLASAEGNASNIGRALVYQKRLNQLITQNKQSLPFLGGRSC